MTLRAYLVEDHVAIRDTLISAMEDVVDVTVVGTARTQSEAVAWLQRHPLEWDLLVVDLFLDEGSGLPVVKACAGRRPGQRVVVLSNYAEVAAPDAMSCGADAVFDKMNALDAFFGYIAGGRTSGAGSTV